MASRPATAAHLENGDRVRATDASGSPKPYLSVAELSRLTPWTEQAIRTMISKGILRCDEHFFYVGRRAVFKWAAIVAFIEGRTPTPASDRLPHYRDTLNRGAKS